MGIRANECESCGFGPRYSQDCHEFGLTCSIKYAALQGAGPLGTDTEEGQGSPRDTWVKGGLSSRDFSWRL